MLLSIVESKLVFYFCSPISSRFSDTYHCTRLDMCCVSTSLQPFLFSPSLCCAHKMWDSQRCILLLSWSVSLALGSIATLISTRIQYILTGKKTTLAFGFLQSKHPQRKPSSMTLPLKFHNIHDLPLIMYAMRRTVGNKHINSLLSLFDSEYPPSENLNFKPIPPTLVHFQFVFYWFNVIHIFFSNHLLQTHWISTLFISWLEKTFLFPQNKLHLVFFQKQEALLYQL